MTEIPKLTATLGEILRSTIDMPKALEDEELLESIGYVGEDGWITDLGRAALAAYDAAERAKIRVEAMRECEAEARCVFSKCNMDDENGVNMAIDAIRALIAKETP